MLFDRCENMWSLVAQAYNTAVATRLKYAYVGAYPVHASSLRIRAMQNDAAFWTKTTADMTTDSKDALAVTEATFRFLSRFWSKKNGALEQRNASLEQILVSLEQIAKYSK